MFRVLVIACSTTQGGGISTKILEFWSKEEAATAAALIEKTGSVCRGYGCVQAVKLF